MRFRELLLACVVATLAVGVIELTFADDTDAPHVSALPGPSTATPLLPTATPMPETWIDRLEQPPRAALGPILLSCLNGDGDGLLSRADSEIITVQAGIPLLPGESCLDPSQHADFFEALSPADSSCLALRPPLHVYIIAGGGADLLDASRGESLGLLDVLNLLLTRASQLGVPVRYTVSNAAIFGAQMAQTSMERFIAGHLTDRLESSTCTRAVLIGHSHGGVTITSVTAAIEDRFPGRTLGVLVDRTPALYDRPAQEMPAHAMLLNFFQTNEGWHGVPIDAPNVINFDASSETAPIAPSDGGGGPSLVTHKTIDDAPAVQRRIVDEILRWATSGP